MPQTDEATRVLAIDDDPTFLLLLRRHLEQIESATFECVQAQTAEEGLAALEDDRVALVLLDYRLGADDGLTVLQQIRDTGDLRPIIVMTAHGDEYVAVKMVQNGADAYLVKGDVSPQRLEETIAQVLETCGQTLEQREEWRQISHRVSTLTPREREVLDLIVAGLTNKEIAARLYRSEKTIKIHRGNVMSKMQASTPADVARMLLTVEPAHNHNNHRAEVEAE